LRLALLAGIVLLYVASIPWYRDSGATPRILLGLPDWVTVALGCYLAVAILNSIAWLCAEVEEREPPEPPSAS
jgi:hypothetical protein